MTEQLQLGIVVFHREHTSHEENIRSDHVGHSSHDRNECDRDHDRRHLAIPLKVRVFAQTPVACRLHGRQERPPLFQLDSDLVIEERCAENCDFKDNREAERDDITEDDRARAGEGRNGPHRDTALDGPCLGQPDFCLDGEPDSDTTLQ